MPQDPKEFAEKDMPEWSRWKHEILLEYLGAFAGILQRYQTVYLVDGFAGAGKHGDGSEGSALRSAKLARSIEHNPSRNYKLRCINVEQNEDIFEFLNQNTRNYSQFVSNYHGGFGDNVWKILGEIAEQPSLFFIDPFGFQDAEWDTLLPIFKRQPVPCMNIITEVLIRFDVPIVSRYAGSVGRDSPQAKANANTLFGLFGVNDEEQWMKLVENTGTTYSGLAEAYQTRLREYFKYVVRMPIRKTTTNQFKYYLIFATQNEKAITAMNNVLYWVEDMRSREIYEAAESVGQLSLFDMGENQIINELYTLKKLILEHLDVGSSVVRADLVTRIATLDDYLGAFSDSHFTAVLGGRTRKIKIPDNFESLEGRIVRDNDASNDKTIITRIK